MVNWEVLIIPLIAFGAWILSTIFKTDEDKLKERLRRPNGRPGPRNQRRPTPPQAETQEEPRRRRDMPEGMESRQQRQRPGSQPIVPQRRPVAPPPPRPAGQRRLAPVLAVVIEEPPKTIIRQRAVVDVAPLPLPVPVPPSAPSPLPAAAPAAPPKQGKSANPILQEVVRLLRTPRSAAAALVMREILDRPYGPPRR